MFEFRTFAIWVLIVAAVLSIALALLRKARCCGEKSCVKPTVWEKLVGLVVIVGLVALGVTGLGTSLRTGGPMHGYQLILHVGLAPVFIGGLVAASLTWADALRLGRTPEGATRRCCMGRLLFWTSVALGLVATLSAVLPMLPLAGYEGLHTMYEVHRYSTVLLVATVAMLIASGGMTRKCA